MGKYLKQGFVRELEWQHNREEISYSKMVELMEVECIKNYNQTTYQFLNWLIKHYDTAITEDGLMDYANAGGEGVSSADSI